VKGVGHKVMRAYLNPSTSKKIVFSLMIAQLNLSGWKDSGRALKKAEKLKDQNKNKAFCKVLILDTKYLILQCSNLT